jgi:hypothetical protein
VPWLASAIEGLAFVPATVVRLFLLALFDRLTAGWTKRVALVAAMLVVLGARRARGRQGRRAFARAGVIEGAVSFASLRVLFATTCDRARFVATGIVVDAAPRPRSRTPTGWLSFAITAVVTLSSRGEWPWYDRSVRSMHARRTRRAV